MIECLLSSSSMMFNPLRITIHDDNECGDESNSDNNDDAERERD